MHRDAALPAAGIAAERPNGIEVASAHLGFKLEPERRIDDTG
jgi:hypothetical protein